MHDAWKDRLSEYLDSELDPAEREAMEAHLMDCVECAATLAQLRQVRDRARALETAPVPPEIWSRIEDSIARPKAAPAVPRRGRFSSFTLPELLAACLAVAIVSGGTVFAVMRHAKPAPARPVPTVAAPTEPREAARAETREPEPREDVRAPSPEMAAEPRGTVPAYTADTGSRPDTSTETPQEEAITELRKTLARERDRLDPGTIRTLESNLAIIDLAIDQAKRALTADPANTYVKEHLAETMRRKVQLLQRATILASTSNAEESR
jgi:hypothetical protein